MSMPSATLEAITSLDMSDPYKRFNLAHQDRAEALDASNECEHGRLLHDRTPDCGCWAVRPLVPLSLLPVRSAFERAMDARALGERLTMTEIRALADEAGVSLSTMYRRIYPERDRAYRGADDPRGKRRRERDRVAA